MAQSISSSGLYSLGGLLLIAAVVGVNLYLYLVQAPAGTQEVPAKVFSTTNIIKEYQPGGIFTKTTDLNKAQATSAAAGIQYKQEELGKTDLSRIE